MSDPGLPLTTGEGNTDWEPDQSKHSLYCAMQGSHSSGRGKRGQCDCGRDALLAERATLREQLDAARQALTELDAELDRYDGLWQDETRKVDPSYARIVQIEAHQSGLRWARERCARAVLGVEGPAG